MCRFKVSSLVIQLLENRVGVGVENEVSNNAGAITVNNKLVCKTTVL